MHALLPTMAGLAVLIGLPDVALSQDEPASDAAGAKLQVLFESPELSIQIGARPILRYRYTDAPFKPYMRELYSPGGVNVLRDAPADHKHHHGLMFALSIDGVSFWAEENDAGRQIRTNSRMQTDRGRARFTVPVVWKSKDVVAREQREIGVLSPPEGESVTLVTWNSRLMSDRDRTLGGSHYYGLGMRLVESMDGSAAFFNPTGSAGKVFRGDERLVRANWCAVTGPIDGKPVTIAMFDHPDNPRHPATWFTMAKPFAYLSATMGLHTEPMPLKKGATLNLRYGVAVWDGRVDAERVEKTYQYWLSKTRGAERSR